MPHGSSRNGGLHSCYVGIRKSRPTSISATVNLVGVVNGDKEFGHALQDITKDTLTCSARCATTSVIATGVEKIGGQFLGKTAASVMLRGSGPMAIATCIFDTGTDAVKGKLTVKKTAKNAGQAASGWVGTEGGGIIGTIIGGPLGAVFGGLIGGVLGSMGFCALFD